MMMMTTDLALPRAALGQVRNTGPGLDTQRCQPSHGAGKCHVCHVMSFDVMCQEPCIILPAVEAVAVLKS